MTPPPPTTPRAGLEQSLRRVHFGVLGILATCAGVVLLTAEPDASRAAATGLDPPTAAAIALAVISILTRRRRPALPAQVRSHVALSVVSLLAAAGVGLAGVAAAVAGAPRTTALVTVLAGAIFALRPPLGVADRSEGNPT